MSAPVQSVEVSTAATASNGALSEQTIALLHGVAMFQPLDEQTLRCLEGATELHLEDGGLILSQGEVTSDFWILLDGHIRISATNAQGREEQLYIFDPGSSFGEIALLSGMPSLSSMRAQGTAYLLRLSEDQFWRIMTDCPSVRRAVLRNMAIRLAKMQGATFQQEKMASLGTLAAGLMHELNNPGAAARRASALLRERLTRMHRLTAEWARTELTHEQKECMFELQEHALNAQPVAHRNTLEQADAEEALAEWMEQAQIQDAWKLAPTFVSIGIGADVLDCARVSLNGPFFSNAINWLEALVSSMQLVGTIEESVGRVSELVMAVKSYAYEGRGGQKQDLDVNRSILATLVVLGHKLREKEIVLKKDLSGELPPLHSDCQGLNQIWTNLLDNAIDAAPQGGVITIKTWAETDPANPSLTDLCILVSDNGGGIPRESQPRIFDPFYTTKPVGVGTGLGLGIVHRIVEQFRGTIRFTSQPGDTEFVVRLPNPAS